jgi:hypothetical protein
MIGFISTSVTFLLFALKYSAISELHNLHFNVAHALGFSISTSRLIATDFNTETIASNHYDVFLLFRLQSELPYFSVLLCISQFATNNLHSRRCTLNC